MQSLSGAGILALHACSSTLPTPTQSNTDCHRGLRLGPLQAADRHGIRLPAGFSARIIAVGGLSMSTYSQAKSDYHWHRYADGGATFATEDGGWIYVSNSETAPELGGGASAIRFDANANIIDAYRILADTDRNCAGGATPWNTWLSCEEIAYGQVWECDIYGQRPAEARPALGLFKHEAVAIDTVNQHLYLTEDERKGCLYRFIPDRLTADGFADLRSGRLQVAIVNKHGVIHWANVPNPQPKKTQTATRRQIPASTHFNGGEGIWYFQNTVYFTSKGDNRVWSLNTQSQQLTLLYDIKTSHQPILSGVDNITVSQSGQVFVAEDGGDMQVVVLDREGYIAPLLQIIGQDDSEVTGIAFNPAGTKLYCSSQRAQGLGITYEISGPFNRCLTL